VRGGDARQRSGGIGRSPHGDGLPTADARQERRTGEAEQQLLVASPTSAVLTVGCRRDPRFGPVLLVGLGGILAEVLLGTAVALAPPDPDEIGHRNG
jgi:acetate---CoA ligase (ADP-forming)